MKKKSQSDFNAAVRKRANLFAEQAMVVTLGIRGTHVMPGLLADRGETIEPLVSGGSASVQDKDGYDPQKLQNAFLDFLARRGVNYAVVEQKDETLTFAVKRTGDFDNAPIRGLVSEFFTGGKRLALLSEGYREKYVPAAKAKNALLKPFSKTRRDVARALKGL
ncbi:MAG: hypothetical protein GC185_01285 [Alphaproteobacteria bacterium]|nr:hypothetical protein [Alphaproteobacteria bacterium]